MRIGYYTDIFPHILATKDGGIKIDESTFSGGVGDVVYKQVIHMLKNGHEVYIFTSANNRENGSINKYGNLTVIRYKSHFKISSAPISLHHLYTPFFSKIDLDIVHSHIGNFPAPLGGALYANIRKKPFFVTYHEDLNGGYGSILRRSTIWFLNTFFLDRILSQADVVITPSEYYIEKSTHLNKIKDKVISIPNGIILEDYQIKYSKKESRDILGLPEEENILLFVGSLTPRKAPDVLINAMNIILKNCQNTRLLFVGDGNYRDELESLAKEHGILENITFMGFVDDETKKICYSASDIFVLPSRSEGFGIVLLEASAYGLPLVVSNLEVFHSVVKDGYNGFFTEKENVDDLASKIISLLNDADLRLDMGKNGQEKVKEFSWEHTASETEKIYNSIV